MRKNLAASEVARRLGLRERTIYRLIDDGKLVALRWSVCTPVEEVEAVLDAGVEPVIPSPAPWR
ncbi:MAG: helix-turn-helix domain-containing protein [Actinomycetota bacterium]|nr:helix-turn-helix domain-containing protein [Actinomycetota bacterium]